METAKGTCAIGGVTLGSGMPKICVPVMGESIEAVRLAAAAARRAKADLIELRLDSLGERPSAEEALRACAAAKEGSEGLALLATFRTKRDGGPGSDDPQYDEQLLRTLLEHRACDAVDVELSLGETRFAAVAKAAKERGIPVVGSSHAFGHLDDLTEIGRWYAAQKACGADVLKAAVMAHSPREALRIAAAMQEAGEALSMPYIAIAMGPHGAFLRAGCEAIGSCLTFGTALEASAPGQIDALKLRAVLEILHQAAVG